MLIPTLSGKRVVDSRAVYSLARKPIFSVVGSVIGLFKTEVLHRDGPWHGVKVVATATLEWVAWRNEERLLEPLADDPKPTR